MQAADLYRAQEAMRGQLSELAASGIDFNTMNKIAVVEEAIRKAGIALSRSALDIAASLRAGIPTASEVSSEQHQ